jgi:hypothetical protein
MSNNDAPVSKMQAIRQYLAEHPDASPRAVAKALVAAVRFGTRSSSGWLFPTTRWVRCHLERSDV